MTNKIQHFPSRLWRLLFLALPLAACTSEVTDEDLQGDASPIAFRTAEVTKAVVTGFNDGDAFSVWGGYDNDATNVFDGVTVTNSNGSWTYSPYQYWIAGKTYKFYAVYPTTVSANVDANGAITVTDFDASKTGAEAVDLMTASAEAKGSDKAAVAFTFNHELARLSFTIISEGDEVNIISAALMGVDYKGTLSNGSWSNQTASDNSNPFIDSQVSLTATALSATLFGGDLLLIPDTDLTNAQLSLAYYYGDKSTEVKNSIIDLSTAAVAAWEKGKSYQYKVTIPQDAVDVSFTVEVSSWIPSNTTIEW